jgi:hypothetical protein
MKITLVSIVRKASVWSLPAEDPVLSWTNLCGVCGEQSGTGTDFSPSTLVSCCQYHYTNALLISIYTLLLPEGRAGFTLPQLLYRSRHQSGIFWICMLLLRLSSVLRQSEWHRALVWSSLTNNLFYSSLLADTRFIYFHSCGFMCFPIFVSSSYHISVFYITVFDKRLNLNTCSLLWALCIVRGRVKHFKAWPTY